MSHSFARSGLLLAVVLTLVPAWSRPAQATDVGLSGPARPAGPLSLADAVRWAVKHSPVLAASGIDVSIAEAGVRGASGLDDFVLGASARWQTDTNRYFGNRAFRQLPYDQLGLGAQLARPLAGGGRLALRLNSDFTRFRDAPPDEPNEWVTQSAQAEYFQPLLRGAGRDTARAEQRRARANQDLAVLQKQATLAALLRDVSTAYWDLYYARAQLEIARASQNLAEEQLAAVKASIEVGKEPSSAAAEVEVATALREAEVISAEQFVRQNSLLLAGLLGLPITNDDSTLIPSDTPENAPHAREAGPLLALAMEQNPDLRVVRQRGRGAQIEVEVGENGILPQLDLTVSGGPTGNAPTLSAAFSSLTELNRFSALASVTLSQPLGRNAAEGQLAAARQRSRRVRMDEADLTLQIRSAVLTAVDRVHTATRRIEVLGRATSAASFDLEATRARFAAGRASTFDVLRRQDGLATARLREELARADYQRAVAEVEALTTDILDRYGLSIH